MGFAIFNSVTIPLLLNFDEIDAHFNGSAPYRILDWSSVAVFILDIYFQMNTTYYDSDGEEIFNKTKIRATYARGLFPIDLLSSLPFGKMGKEFESFKVLTILKVVRVSRLTTVINKMDSDEEDKSLLRLLYIVFKLVLAMHLVGSFWYGGARRWWGDKTWIPPLDFVYAGIYPRIYRSWSEDYNDVYRYAIGHYNALLFLGGNEMGPRADADIAVCTIVLIALAIFNAYLFGDMAVLTEMMGRK